MRFQKYIYGARALLGLSVSRTGIKTLSRQYNPLMRIDTVGFFRYSRFPFTIMWKILLEVRDILFFK